MIEGIKEIIYFQLSGKFAHFRKFYTNSSSLSYSVPPRTALTGLLASILKIPRDNYYDIFAPDKIKFSVNVDKDSKIKKVTQSLNYIHYKYYKMLVGKSGKFQHSQCKFELLTSKNHKIKYNVYIALLSSNEKLKRLQEKLKNRNFGYGLYLGQRPFHADISKFRIIPKDKVKFLSESEFIDSYITTDRIKELDITRNPEASLLRERMPCHFKKVKKGREIADVKTFAVEKNGKRLFGSFENIIKVKDKHLYFH